MSQLAEYLKMALSNIRSNKGRSFLTMLGIVIGISSVIMIMGVGNGFKKEMNEQLDAFAGGQIFIYMNDEAYNNLEYLGAEDMEAVEGLEGVTGTSPSSSDTGTVLAPKGNFDVLLEGGGSAGEEVSGVRMVSGRYYKQGDIATGNHVCVIDKKDAIRAFGTQDILGMNLQVTLYNITVDLTIIGISEPKNEGSLVTGGYENERISLGVPYTVFEAFGWEVADSMYGFYITTNGTVESGTVAQNAIQLLNKRHYSQGDNYYNMQDYNDQVSQVNDMLGMITGFISVVAGISLLVGGIGVMNIMLVSVTERTREIGIRKALGAKTSSITMQFLAESAIISCIGGMIGIAIGIGLAYVICSVPSLGFPPGIQLSTVLLATLFSSGIGIFFGLYPARKAAKLSPIEALRRD